MLPRIATAVAAMIAELPGMPLNAVSCRHIHDWTGQALRVLRVAVSPRAADINNASRGAVTADYRVGIVVAKAASTEEDAREVFAIAEAVLDAVRGTVTLDLPNSAGRVAFQSASFECGSDDMLNEQNVYRATIEATYKVLKGP